MDNEILISLIGVFGNIISATATILAALIVGIAGAMIGQRYARERDRQDKESQWRQHAIELTKLDLERKIKTWPEEKKEHLRPTILDFLANYRDLQQLGEMSPKELYLKIIEDRIQSVDEEVDNDSK